MNLLKLIACSATVAIGLSACSPLECTMVGCDLPLYVTISPSTTQFVPGVYVLEIVRDGVPTSCSFEVASAASAEWFLGACDPGAEINLYGGGLDHEVRLGFWNEVSDLSIVISRDGATLLSSTTQHTYSEHEPNQPGCGPFCSESDPVSLEVEGAPDTTA